MRNLQEATEQICQIKGECIALQVAFDALIRTLPPSLIPELLTQHSQATEIARVTLLNSDRNGEHVISGFELHVQNMSSNIRGLM